jgi:hypothetical protein
MTRAFSKILAFSSRTARVSTSTLPPMQEAALAALQLPPMPPQQKKKEEEEAFTQQTPMINDA